MACGKPHFTWPLESDLLIHCSRIPLENCYFSDPSLGESPILQRWKGSRLRWWLCHPGSVTKIWPLLCSSMLPLECTNELLAAASFEPLLSLLVCTGVFRNVLRPITAAFQPGKTKMHPSHKVDRWQALALLPSARGVQCQSPVFCSHQDRGKAHH